ncbi:transmembrane protein 158 [Callorhinchus milii]|uniref:transmembrane protein 158 n=1 Tax=Callorhinchus milii TaxID=7868 RepID=UPI001C3FD2C1|nr:transmembrane protein 158 [Callorhinchus milii]
MTAHLPAPRAPAPRAPAPRALLAVLWALVAAGSWAGGSGGAEDHLLLPPPRNASLNLSLTPPLRVDSAAPGSGSGSRGPAPAPAPAPGPGPNPCNITARRLAATSLLVRWERSSRFECDVLLFSTSSPGRSFFSAALSRVSSPATIDHVGVGGGQGQQLFKLCVGCGGARLGRSGPRRTAAPPPPPPPHPPPPPSPPRPQTHHLLQAEWVNFCCLDFRLEELRGDPGWRFNRKPIESTLVACFMTVVIIIWSVAALIWPVPIIAGFLPNGMEQRRG